MKQMTQSQPNHASQLRLRASALSVNRSAEKIFSDNLGMLMQMHEIKSENALAHMAHVSQKTIWRIRRMQQSPTLDMVERIGRVFDLPAWKMISPEMDRRKSN